MFSIVQVQVKNRQILYYVLVMDPSLSDSFLTEDFDSYEQSLLEERTIAETNESRFSFRLQFGPICFSQRG